MSIGTKHAEMRRPLVHALVDAFLALRSVGRDCNLRKRASCLFERLLFLAAMSLTAVVLALGASPPVQQTSLASTEAAAKLPFTQPEWTIGYYAWIWAPEQTRTKGAQDSTLGVQFTVCASHRPGA